MISPFRTRQDRKNDFVAIKLLPAIGVLAGAAIFVVADALLGRYSSSSSGFALVTDVTLEGTPENIALGSRSSGGAA